MSTVFYKKVGRRYIPVSEYSDELFDSLPYGVTMVHIKPNGQSWSYQVDPDFEAVDAALEIMKDDMVNIFVELMELKPKPSPFTDRQRELWNELKGSFNEQDFWCIRESMYDMARGLQKKIKDKIKEQESGN
jgi:hypothetical protein